MPGKVEPLVAEVGVGVEERLSLCVEIGIVGAEGQDGEEPPFEIEFQEVHRVASKREPDASPRCARAAIAPRIHDRDWHIEEEHQTGRCLQEGIDRWRDCEEGVRGA